MIKVFDYLLTLEKEITLIWKSKWGVAKVLYMLSKFPPFIDVPLVLWYSLTPNIPMRQCHPIYSISSWFTLFGILIAEMILMMRTIALWGRDSKVSTVLVILIILGTVTCIVVLVLFLRSLKYGPPPLSTVVGCYPTEGSIILFVDFVILILYESIMLSLTMWVGFKKFRHSGNPLIKVLYRDGIYYFIYTFLISLGNILVLVAGPPELVDLLNTFQRVMHSILSTRVILHIRHIDRNVHGGREITTSRLEAPAWVSFLKPGNFRNTNRYVVNISEIQVSMVSESRTDSCH
ncbi:hypothetical protein VKT23_001497 [Stygiomarasmius scandens]|uniref:DUF6533 domain-containing protein n=1 Tax=Marasmiellus scandens TaxID=2682957 RepID=A0ABR1K1Y2_9AGAR